MNEMYKYLEEHNYISKNENKDPLIQQELSTARAECIVNKHINLVEKLQQENKILKDNWNKLKKDLELVVDYGLGDESSKWDKIYGEYAKSTLKFMQELEQGSDSNVKD